MICSLKNTVLGAVAGAFAMASLASSAYAGPMSVATGEGLGVDKSLVEQVRYRPCHRDCKWVWVKVRKCWTHCTPHYCPKPRPRY